VYGLWKIIFSNSAESHDDVVLKTICAWSSEIESIPCKVVYKKEEMAMDVRRRSNLRGWRVVTRLIVVRYPSYYA